MNDKQKPQLSWSQPITSKTSSKPSQNAHADSSEPRQSSTPASAASGAGMELKNKNRAGRNIIIAAVGLIVIAGIVWAVEANKNTKSATSLAQPAQNLSTGAGAPRQGSAAASAALSDGSLSLPSPQSSGLEVSVSHIVVTVPTWVVIYENYNGQPGNALGAGLFTPERRSGVVDLLRGTLPGQTYFAGEARDDGDHMFSMVNDPAVRDAGGNPIVLQFQTN